MRKKLFLSVIALLVMGVALGQEAPGYIVPNYEQIKKDCLNKHSDRYYPTLVKRFAEADTSLQLEDLQTLYYGQAFQQGFFPYAHYHEQFGTIRAIINSDDEPTPGELDTIVSLANAVIAQNPAEPMAYYYKFIGENIASQYFDGDSGAAQRTQLQFQMLFYTIASTGNGLTPQLTMHVVNTSHEYMMMNMYGFRMKSQALMNIDGHSYDMFVIDTNEYGVDTLYFNIDRIVGAWSSLFPDKEEPSPVTSVDLELGVKFVLQLEKPKRKNSNFILVSKQRIADTLIANRDSLFREPVPENQIVGYFCPMRLHEDSDHVFNCLVFISNSGKDWLYYDAFIAYGDHVMEFRPTSNSGIPRNAMMNEMWPTDVQGLRISNIRTKK